MTPSHIKFKPMLAKAPKDFAKISYPLAVQDKLDGIRATVVNSRLVSRTLKPIPNQEIREALERPEFEGLDGELIVGDPTHPDCYRTTNSFVMAESKTGAPWCFHVFDKWDEDAGFEIRFSRALAVVREAGVGFGVDMAIVPYRVVGDEAELAGIEAARIEAGHEGVIARVPGSAYKFGRSGQTGPLIKVKRFVDFEAEVIGVYEEMHNANEAKTNELGRTARSSHKAGKVGKGRLGGLVLKALPNDDEKAPSAGVEFRCGTGFKRDERIELWTIDLTGRTAKVKFFPIGNKDKPRHPVFLGWREVGIDG